MVFILLLLLTSSSKITAADAANASPYAEFVKAYVQNFNVKQFLADTEQMKLALENLHALQKLLPYATRDQMWRPLGNMRGGKKDRENWDSIVKTHNDLMGCSLRSDPLGYFKVTGCTKCDGKTPDEQTRCANRIGFIVNHIISPKLQKLLSEDKSLGKLSESLLTIIVDYAKEE